MSRNKLSLKVRQRNIIVSQLLSTHQVGVAPVTGVLLLRHLLGHPSPLTSGTLSYLDSVFTLLLLPIFISGSTLPIPLLDALIGLVTLMYLPNLISNLSEQ